jgi:hypothetical protein
LNGENFTNYFNYFTEIEEHFQRARGTSLFLLSPLDWALIETWKNSGIPLEAVLRGIDGVFEKWRAKRSRVQMVNSIAYCAQAVMAEAQRLADNSPGRAVATAGTTSGESAPFPPEALRRHVEDAAGAVHAAGADFLTVKESLDQILADLPTLSIDLEALEQRLTGLEQKLVAIVRARQTEAQALEMRQKLESHLRPWRSKMTAPQIAMLEIQYLDRATLESAGLPRLSLFYVR